MSEYFGFKRRPQEHIGAFLVRETLGFEEFSEALLRSKSERDGIDPASRNFDLPDISPDTDDEGRYWRQCGDWRHWTGWHDNSLNYGFKTSPSLCTSFRTMPSP